MFLQLYESYSTEVKERAKQLLGKEISSTQSVSPTSLKFCINREQLGSFVELRFTESATFSEDLTDESLKNYLESKSKRKHPT